jgi:hypothetical protein
MTIASVWLPSSLVWTTVGVAGPDGGAVAGDRARAAASRVSGERRSV